MANRQAHPSSESFCHYWIHTGWQNALRVTGERLLSLERETELGLCGILDSSPGAQTWQVMGDAAGLRVTPLVQCWLHSESPQQLRDFYFLAGLSGLLWIYLAITIPAWEFP